MIALASDHTYLRLGGRAALDKHDLAVADLLLAHLGRVPECLVVDRLLAALVRQREQDLAAARLGQVAQVLLLDATHLSRGRATKNMRCT